MTIDKERLEKEFDIIDVNSSELKSVEKYKPKISYGVFSSLVDVENEHNQEDNINEEIATKKAILQAYKKKADNYESIEDIDNFLLSEMNKLTSDIAKAKKTNAEIESLKTNQLVVRIKFIENLINQFSRLVESTVTDEQDKKRLLTGLKALSKNTKSQTNLLKG